MVSTSSRKLQALHSRCREKDMEDGGKVKQGHLSFERAQLLHRVMR